MRFYWFKEIPSTQNFLYTLIKQCNIHVPLISPPFENPIDNLYPPILVAASHQTQGIGSRNNQWEPSEQGLYFSFALHISQLPKDLLLQSSSIYFGWLFLQKLRKYNKKVWLKWPNDLYIEGKIGGIMTQIVRDFMICGIGINICNSKYSALFDKRELLMRDEQKSERGTLSKILYEVLDFLSFNSVEFDIQEIATCDMGSNQNKELQYGYYPDYDSFQGFCLTTNSIGYSRIDRIDAIAKDCLLKKLDFFSNISWRSVFDEYQQEFYKNSHYKTHITKDSITQEIKLSDCTLREDGSLMVNNRVFYSLR